MRFQLAVYKNLLFLSQRIDTTIRIPGTQCMMIQKKGVGVFRIIIISVATTMSECYYNMGRRFEAQIDSVFTKFL